MKVRVAMQGWDGGKRAETQEDVKVGIRLPWIEIDGTRYTDGVISASFRAGEDDVSTIMLELLVVGTVEVLYVGSDGEPLPGTPLELADPTELPPFDCDTAIDRSDLEVKP